ncbi:hypothetical protein APHAL10511_001242 [Amanita phalloides]|nr:hypothetical protein APHAL10511_001242 [Amanita phalloides]
MSRDRLAALRAQRQGQQQQQAHELTTLTPPAPGFAQEVTSVQSGIDQLNGNVSIIATLHGRLVNVVSEGTNPDAQQLDLMREETRTLVNQFKDRIKSLETIPAGPDANIRRNQVTLLRSNFVDAVRNYQRVEQDYSQQSRRRIERQLKIVKPDATDDEVREAVEGGGDQIFTKALTTSTRYGESRAAYREVQQRQQDLHKMEETLADLAQLLGDMAILVAQQDELFTNIDKAAADTEANTKQGLEETKKAVVHARRYPIVLGVVFVSPTASVIMPKPRQRGSSIGLVDAKAAVDLATAQSYSENVFLFVPNLIGYTRIILAGLSLHFMSYHPKYCTLAYVVSCLLDAVDGQAARALGQTSKFGAVLDMVTDRCTTSCLLCYLSSVYPNYAILFQFLIALDFSSHYMHMYSSLVTGSRSHKLVTSDVSRILWLYYNDSRTLFFVCAGNELFFVSLYLMKWVEKPVLGELTWAALLACVSFPVFVVKNIINLVQLWKASKILVGVDLAERAKERDRSS